MVKRSSKDKTRSKTSSDAGPSSSTDSQKVAAAERTLNRLIEEAGPEAVRARLRASGRSTRNAMDELFDESNPRQSPGGFALVTLDDSKGVAAHDSEEPESSEQSPRLAGAEDAESEAPQPEAAIRQLDDGVDFWGDLDRTGGPAEDEEED